jgi:pimeloyl-ACP methyl ester carboxylesterase
MKKRVLFSLVAALVGVLLPATPAKAIVLWQSTPAHTDEVKVFTSTPFSWFNGSHSWNTTRVHIWNEAAVTTTASTTLHIWLHDASGTNINYPFYVGLSVSSGGDPFFTTPTQATHLLGNGYVAAALRVPNSETPVEIAIPVKPGVTISPGDELWVYVSPPMISNVYGGIVDTVYMGGALNMPRLQVCEGPCETTPPSPTYCTQGTDPNCNSNVMFLPGIEGSRLYTSGLLGENQIWEPDSLTENDLSALDMRNINSLNSVFAKDGEILDAAYKNSLGFSGKPIYISFINSLNKLVSDEQINAWKPIAYDWRLDYSDLLANGSQNVDGRIYYRGANAATSTPYIVQELRRLAASSKTGKVTIIAHSNGGLLAKALLAHPEYATHVDKLILVASPQIGTPEAVGALLHGFGQGFPLLASVFFSDVDARSLGQNTPMVYNLLPSNTYFQFTQNPVITFDPVTLQDWVHTYGQNINTQNQLRIFMTDIARAKPSAIDLVTPEIVNEQLYFNSIGVHAELDNWSPPSGLQVIAIAGWGNETLSGIAYKKVPQFTCLIRAADGSCAASGNKDVLTYSPRFVIDGDDTVAESSAHWSNGATTTRYWLDLMSINSASASQLGHGTIFEVPELRTLLVQLISNSTPTISAHVSDSKPTYTGSAPRLYFTLHSPLTLSFYDTQGNFTGSTATSTYFNIPGVHYERFGEVQWLSVPKSMAGRVVMQGTGSGSFALDIEEVNGNEVLATTTFAAVPSATSTYAYVDINPAQSATASSTLIVDFDGNGTPDSTLKSKQGATVLPDITPPSTTATTTGTLGKNGWYTGNVQISFNTIDTESGVTNTFFSLNGAATSTGTSTTIATEGTHVLRFYSTDNAGNTETLKTLTIKIDKTPPEAKMAFNTLTQLLDITGIDTLSSTTVQTTATSSIITDQAGHTLQMLFTQSKPKDRRINVTISSLKYDGLATTTNATLKYKWKTDKDNVFTMLASYLKTPTSTVESHYRPKKNQTIIMQAPQDLDDSDNDDNSDSRPTKISLSGLVVPFFTTNNGVVVGAW